MSRGKRRGKSSGAGAAFDPLLQDASDLGVMLAAQAELGKQQQALEHKIGPVSEEYDKAWAQELWRRAEEAGLSWCTYCNEVKEAQELEDAFTVDWHTEGYDPQAFWRYTEWYRACQDCLNKETFAPKPASEYAERLQKNPEGPMWTRDHRNDKRLRDPTALAALLEMPPSLVELRKMGTRADIAVAIEEAVAPAFGSRSRPSVLAERVSAKSGKEEDPAIVG